MCSCKSIMGRITCSGVLGGLISSLFVGLGECKFCVDSIALGAAHYYCKLSFIRFLIQKILCGLINDLIFYALLVIIVL